jgi:hypothetical protein
MRSLSRTVYIYLCATQTRGTEMQGDIEKARKVSCSKEHISVMKLRKERVENGKRYNTWHLLRIVFLLMNQGFKLHTQRSVGRSLKGTPARGTIPTGKGVTSILVAIPEA